MFQLFRKLESPQLVKAIVLADAMAKERGHNMYVVKVCDDDYEVSGKIPDKYEYKAKP